MNLKVGDKARVRSWEDMEKEFGLDGFGNINMNTPRFTIGMKKYCKKVVEIVVIKENFYIVAGNSWQWTDQMLDPVEFDWEAFKDKSKKIAVHCKTEEEAKDFCRQMHEHGMEWSNGDSYLDKNLWCFDKEYSCYTAYGTLADFEDKKFTILEYEDYFINKEEKKEFTLSDLKDEMIVKMRNGSKYVYINGKFMTHCGCLTKDRFLENFKYRKSLDIKYGYDIVEVYPPSKNYTAGLEGMLTPNAEPIWAEKKEVIIPKKCKEILKNISKKFNWIAKDKDGFVYIYENKPIKCTVEWNGNDFSSSNCKEITSVFDDSLFDWLSWKDEDPVNFREILKME